MTAVEWIELAQDRIRDAGVTDCRFNNIGKIDDAIKFLNKAKVLIEEHQTGLFGKIKEVLITKCQAE